MLKVQWGKDRAGMGVSADDRYSGWLLIGIGLGALLYTGATLKTGFSLNMGPGYFPLVLSGLLVFLGLLILLLDRSPASSERQPVPWRALLAILGAPLLFGAFIDELGLVPALAGSVLLASLASRRMGARFALQLTAGLVLACVAVFVWALGAPLRLFGPWLTALAGQ
jgi:hypothetical protein